MDNRELDLISELFHALNQDVGTLNVKMEKVEEILTKAPPDYRASIEGLTKTVQAWQHQPKPVPPAADLSAITARFDRLEQISRQRPEYKMSQYVQYGAYAFGLMVILLVGMSWLAFDWRQERDQYAQNYTWANWRLRYLKQAEPQYYQAIEGKFEADADGVGRWIEQQEQADATREAARQAAEQAAALTKQANQLEGKKKPGR